MAIKVTLRNPSQANQGTTENPDQSITLDRSIYQTLGSLIKNKNILHDYENGLLAPEYVEFLDWCNEIYKTQSFPNYVVDIPVEWKLLDEYLGDLGSLAEYHYNKDIVDIPRWLPEELQSEYRVLVDTSDNTYLTTSNPLEVLVAYTGVTNG